MGNTCDFDRTLGDARWTQLVPVWSIGTQAGLTATQLTAVRKYTQARSFHVPAWSADAHGLVYVADFLRPVGVDKRVLSGPNPSAVVQARLSRAGWILLKRVPCSLPGSG